MTTFKFVKLSDGRYRTTITSDFGVVKRLIMLLTDDQYDRAERESRRRRAALQRAGAPSIELGNAVSVHIGDRELVGTVVDYVPATVTGSTGRVLFKEQADQEAIADEDACRAVDAEDDTELDCEGPGAEGVDGGEDR